MADAWEWGVDALTPDKAKVRSPQMNAGYGGDNPDVRSSQYAMSKGQRDVAHYQPGQEMSAPLQNIADRGQARGDLAQQHLSSASANAAALGGQSLGYGEKGYNAGMAGAGFGAQQGAALNAAGGKGGALGAQYGNAMAAQGMAGAGQAAAGQGMAGAAYNDMRASAGQLAGLEAQQGPSAAQAQLRNATNAGQAQNLAMARSGGGFGGSASRSAQAMRQNAAMNQGAANQSAMLKAGEDAAWRQRQASNLQGAGGMYGQSGQLGLGSGQLGLAGNAQAMQGLESGGQLALAGNAQNLQGLQAGTQAGLAGHQMGLQGSQVGLQGTGQAVQSQQAAGQLAATGYGLGYQGDTQTGQAIAQDQAAKQAYENMLTQQMGIQAGVAVGNAQASNAFTGQLLGAAANGGMMMMSDERRKNVGRQVNMSSELYGNPYGRRGAPGAMADDYVMSDERNKRPPRGETTDLRGVHSFEYEYDDPEMPGGAPGLQVGPMAQDIERAIPGAVDDTPQGKMVNPGRTVLPLLSAVGEQQQRIDALEARLNEQPDLRTAENAHRPKGPGGLSFEAYDDAGRNVSDAPNFLERRQARDKTPLAHNQFARAAGVTLTDGLMLPVTLAGRLAEKAGYPNAAAHLDAGKTLAEVESLVRDETLPQSLERQELGAKAHPKATMAGSVAGDVAAGAALGGALKAAPGVKRAGKELATEAAARAYDSPLNVRTNIVPGEKLASDPRLGSVQRFLNEERAAASEYQRHGYDALVDKYGPARAAEIRALTDDTQAALSQKGEPRQVYRGQLMSQDELDELQPGAHLSNPNIWSAGTTRERAGSFSKIKEGDKRSPVLYEINARTGATADDIPGSNTYEEALLPAGGKFDVKGRRVETLPNGQRVNVVQLDEVAEESSDYWENLSKYVREDPSRAAELDPAQITELQKRGVLKSDSSASSAKQQLRESADESEYKNELADAKKYGMARAYAQGRAPRQRDRGHRQHSLAVSRQLVLAQRRADLAEAGKDASAARHNRASLRARAVANKENPFKTEDLAKELSPEDSYWHNMADYVKNTPGGADEIGPERIAELRKRGLL